MTEIEIKTDYIKIGQLLKLGNMTGQGSDAKMLLAQNLVKLNGSIVSQRGKKVYKGDIVEVSGIGSIKVKV